MIHVRWLAVLPVLLRVSSLAAQTTGAGSVDAVGGPRTLIVADAVAGQAPDPASDATARLSINSAVVGSRLTARLLSLLPNGLTLEILASAARGTSAGTVPLSTTPTEILRDIPVGAQSGVIVTYTLHSRTSTGTLPFNNAQVVFELAAGS